MKTKSVFLITSLFFFAAHICAQTPDLDWAFGFGGSSSDYPLAMDIDTSNDIYLTGYFRNTVDFDPGTSSANLTSNGNNDIFIAKYDTAGNYLWAIAIGGSSNDRGYDVKTDEHSNVYVVGSFQGTVDFDPGTSSSSHTSNGSNDIFLAKYDSTGSYLWAIAIGGSGNDQGTSLTLDSNGAPHITGLFENTVDFDPGTATANSASNGGQDIFMAKYNANGSHVWSNGIGGTGDDGGYSLDISSDDSIHITGYFENTVDFNPGSGTNNISSTGSKDIFFGKYDRNGNYVWASALTGSDGSLGSELVTDAMGNVLLSGSYFATIDMDPGTGTANLTSNGSHDGFVAKYDRSGKYVWSFTLGGTSLDRLNHISIDALGNILVTGYYKGTVDFNPGTATFNMTSSTNNDAYLAKYTTLGSFVWAASLGSTGYESGFDIIADTSNGVYATGNFGGTADFDPGSGTYNLTSNGGFDGYLMRLEEPICTPTTGRDTQIACDSFRWIDGKTYSTSNDTAKHTLTNAAGCDSVVTLNLTIRYSIERTDTQTACDSFLWIDGKTYYSSNDTATYTLTNAAGCDSLIKLDLTINHSTTGIDTQHACDSFVWIDGKTYTTSSDTAKYTLTNAVGCDSVVTLDLTITYSSSGQDVRSACDSYTWIDGMTYTSSNNAATHTLTNAAGCDSVVTLDLTILHSTVGTDVQSACDSYIWVDGKTYTASNNNATYTLTNTAGCDSIVTLDLTIQNSTAGTDVQSACDSYIWIDGKTYTSTNNSATHTLSNTAGCDSVVTLDLTMRKSTTGTDVQTSCDSYTWIDGKTYTSSINNVLHTLTNAAGCDSVVTLDLTINTVTDITTSITDGTVQANNTSATYTWLDCDKNYAVIPGETNQTFTPATSGNYAVELTENNCVDTSACVSVSVVGIIENSFVDGFTVYPNPTDDMIHLQFNASQEFIRLNLMDASGRRIAHHTYTHIDAIEYELTQPEGLYILEVTNAENQRSVIRLMKH